MQKYVPYLYIEILKIVGVNLKLHVVLHKIQACYFKLAFEVFTLLSDVM